MSFFEELKRRNVFRVGIAYLVATWLLIQVSDTVFPRIGLPESAVTLVIALLTIRVIPAFLKDVGASLCSRLTIQHAVVPESCVGASFDCGSEPLLAIKPSVSVVFANSGMPTDKSRAKARSHPLPSTGGLR